MRARLANAVEIDLVSRWKPANAAEGGTYFMNYASVLGWHLIPGSIDGRALIGVCRSADVTRPDYLVGLTISAGLVSTIRD